MATAAIVDAEDHTTVDDSGAVRSVQAADADHCPRDALDAIWTPMHLERLARTYWRFLTRGTLGLVRVKYTDQRALRGAAGAAAGAAALPAPEYLMDEHRGDRALADRERRAGLAPRPRRRRPPADRHPPLAGQRRRTASPRTSRWRWPTSIPRSRRGSRQLGVRQHPVAHPRGDDARVPALAGAAGPGRVAGGPLRRRHAAGGPSRAWCPTPRARPTPRRRRLTGGSGRLGGPGQRRRSLARSWSGGDPPHGARARAHHQRFGGGAGAAARRTPARTSPSVTPVAEKKQCSLATRSSTFSTRSRS